MLKEILDKCIGRKINTFLINKDKLFPYDQGKMVLGTQGVEGYYTIMNEKECLLLLSIRDNPDYQVKYSSKNEIEYVYIDNAKYKIFF